MISNKGYDLTNGRRVFHLLPDPCVGQGNLEITIPSGVSFWKWTEAGLIQCSDEDNDARLMFEPVNLGFRCFLLIGDSQGKNHLFVNDQVYRVLAPAIVGDMIRFGNSPAYEVANYQQTLSGPPPETQIGKPCPICLFNFTAHTRVFTCACGTVYHDEIEGQPPLECAKTIGTCICCKEPTEEKEGYFPKPYFFSE